MKMWRVLMSLHARDGEWRTAYSLPTFYVHATSGPHAQAQALQVVNATKDPRVWATSGSCVAIDDKGFAQDETYHSWTYQA